MTALLLCGCGNSGAVPAAVTSAEEITVTEAAAETLTETASSAAETSSVTETSQTAETEYTSSAAQTEISGPSYDLPEEFYNELDEIIHEYPHFEYYDISFAYEDMETGMKFMFNPDKHYYSASVMKAPYMLYIYRLALAGKADTSQKLVYSEKYSRGGTGILKNEEFGGEYTVEELIGLCLEESDNAAFAMLRDIFPEEGYTEFMDDIGIPHSEDSKAFSQPQICCESALIISRQIYNFIKEGNPYSENMKYHMTHSRNEMITGGGDSEVIRKYGWYEGFFHDMALICGERDHSLTIMTNFDMLEIGDEEYRLFRSISKLFYKYSGAAAGEYAEDSVIKVYHPRQEVKEMALPKDPYMLLSVLNMKLRDAYPDLEALCEDMDTDISSVSEPMAKLGYVYSKEENQFIPAPDKNGEVSGLSD